ncbi:MAG: penicillin-binding protein 2, partial [Proteobacteria bacterium]|nr:penicillin-binding protein 2 [Pseudomonadota bacterium]
MSRFALKDHFRESRLVNDRLIFAAIFVVILFIVVMVRLAILQVVEHEHFNFLSDRNRVDIAP